MTVDTLADRVRRMSDGVNPFWNDPNPPDYEREVSIDGADTTLPKVADVAEILHDGYCAGVVRLHDGRYVAWATFEDVTGHGFAYDAYGGDADIYFANTLDGVLRWGLTDEARRILKVTLDPPLRVPKLTRPQLTMLARSGRHQGDPVSVGARERRTAEALAAKGLIEEGHAGAYRVTQLGDYALRQ